MIPLLVVLAVLLLLLFLPLGVRLSYDQAGFRAWARVACFSFRVYPPRPKDPDREARIQAKKKRKAAKKAKKQRKKDKKAKPTPPEEEQTPGGTLRFLFSALSPLAHAAGRLVRKIRIRELTLRVTWAAGNPADAAIGFGYANAALGILWGMLSANFHVRNPSLSCDVDYDAHSPTALFRARAVLTLGQALAVAIPLLFRLVRLRARQSDAAEQTTTKEALNHE